MDPITIGLLAGAGMGLVKGGVLDQGKEKRQRKQEAEIARYSPWTGMQAQRVQEADPLGSTMQGAMGGAMLGSAFGAAGGAGGAGAAAGGGAEAAGAAGGAGMAPPPPLDPSAAASYTATPYATAAQSGQPFQQYAQQQYFSPWSFMR